MLLKTLISSLKSEAQLAWATRDIQLAELRTLRRILKKASSTAFGATHKLCPRMSVNEYRRAVPIHGYLDYIPWIQRIQKGAADVLWPGRPLAFVTTSGTTGVPKIIPVTRDFLDDYHRDSSLTFHRIMLRHPQLLLGSILALGGPIEEYKCHGIPVGSITGQIYSTLPEPMRSRLVLPSGPMTLNPSKIRCM